MRAHASSAGAVTGDAAFLAEQGLRARGVEIVGPHSDDEGGVVVSLVDVDGDRTMASDRGAAPGLRAEDIEPGWFAGAAALHLSGYSLLREPIAGAARHAAVLARAAGARVSVDLAAAPLIASHGAARFRAELAELAPDVVFATHEEELALGGPLPVEAWVRKRGPDGCELLTRGEHLVAADRAGRRRRLDRRGRRARRRLPRGRRSCRGAARGPCRCGSLRRDARGDATECSVD